MIIGGGARVVFGGGCFGFGKPKKKKSYNLWWFLTTKNYIFKYKLKKNVS